MSTSLNLGGNLPPRLRPQHTLWSLGKLPMNSETEWTLDEKFERVAAAGFALPCAARRVSCRDPFRDARRHPFADAARV